MIKLNQTVYYINTFTGRKRISIGTVTGIGDKYVLNDGVEVEAARYAVTINLTPFVEIVS